MVTRLSTRSMQGWTGLLSFFSQRSEVDIEELRTTYLSGMMSMFVGLSGTHSIDRVLGSAGAGKTIDDGLDWGREGWSGTALMAAAYLGRIDELEALLA